MNIKIKFKTDATMLFKRLQHMQLARPSARREACKEMGRSLIRTLDKRAPRDTNRYIRGWIQAGNNAGLTNIAMPAIIKSGRHDQFVAALTEQALFWKDLEEKLQTAYSKLYGYRETTPVRAGRGGRRRSQSMPPGQADLLARLRKAEANRKRAFQELDRVMSHADQVIMVGLFSTVAKGLAAGKGRTLTRTTRYKVYGGDGRVVELPHSTMILLHNKEPHAQLVENRTKVLARAQAAVRALGAKTAGKRYVMEIEKAARAA